MTLVSLPARWLAAVAAAVAGSATGSPAAWHVSTGGDDTHAGTATAPLRTIQAAAERAHPGDVITVHEGVYRERVNPPRGGSSETQRIVYQAAPGEAVVLKGSEVIQGWNRVRGEVWQVTLPNSFFGGFNPYADEIRGDWFDPRGRRHHTGAVYLEGEWLTEAAALEELFLPAGTSPSWLERGERSSLFTLGWWRLVPGGGEAGRVPAGRFSRARGVQRNGAAEGGEGLDEIEPGDWACYAGADFGAGAEGIEIRAAAATEGGIVEVRLGGPEGRLVGRCVVAGAGAEPAWASYVAPLQPVRGVQTVCLVFQGIWPFPRPRRVMNPQLWLARVGEDTTTIWAQFPGGNPNEREVEINVRQTVFYPDQPGRDFITVRGFTLQHAATPWAPPTAEQIGLIGTHWSRGWIIESNRISHSACAGLTLGKYGDAWDNTSGNAAPGYVQTIERALQHGWSRETIGHHQVRGNTIAHCEQAGIVGSLGAAFSVLEGNVIHDIHVRRLFGGAEMAGIKLHGAIDTVIRSNHLYRTGRGLWLDWMAQGTRVTGNLMHDQAEQDLFLEVNHGPLLVDHNLLLSPVSLLDLSQGSAFAHNLFAGRIISRPDLGRRTPYHAPHETRIAGLSPIRGGDHRFFNNWLFGIGGPALSADTAPDEDPQWAGGHGLWIYDFREFPSSGAGNVSFDGARPGKFESGAVMVSDPAPDWRLTEEGGGWYLEITLDESVRQAPTAMVTSGRLGLARVPQLPYVNADGSALRLDRDYFGQARNDAQPSAGPFEDPGLGRVRLRVR